MADTYPLGTTKGFTALYQDAFGTTAGLPPDGTTLEWVPELSRMLHDAPTTILDPLQAEDLQMLFRCIDLQSCFRVANPVAQSPILLQAVKQRYQRLLLTSKSSPPHPINGLTPGHYRHFAVKGPIDRTFLYPPLAVADLALAIAVSRSRIGVALWIPRAYLSNMTPNRLKLLSAFKLQRRLAIVQD